MVNLPNDFAVMLLALNGLVDVSEEIIKGSIHLDIDVDRDVDGFDFDRLDIDFMPGTG